MKTVIKAIPFVVFSLFFLWGIVFGFDQKGKADCAKWAREATTYEGFYLTRSQADQCDYYAIPVNAPVK